MTGVTVLGSTGSIGVSTLDVLARHPDRFHVVALTANRDVEAMLAQCLRFRPDVVAMADPQAALALRERLAAVEGAPEVLAGMEGLTQAATLPEAGVVMAAIVGAAGLVPTLAAAHAGKRLLLANKEALVVAGALLMAAVADRGAVLLPIDSEHNAIFQCLPAGFSSGLARVGVERILLTASGGPFLNTPLRGADRGHPGAGLRPPQLGHGAQDLGGLRHHDEQGSGADRGVLAVRHGSGADAGGGPPPERHPLPGAVCGWLGPGPTRQPGYAHPHRPCPRLGRSGSVSGVPPLDLFAVGRLDFEPPDLERFPCLALAIAAAAPAAGRPRRSSTRPTRSRWLPSLGAESDSWPLPTSWMRPLRPCRSIRWPVKTSHSCWMWMVVLVPSRNKRSHAGSHRPP